MGATAAHYKMEGSRASGAEHHPGQRAGVSSTSKPPRVTPSTTVGLAHVPELPPPLGVAYDQSGMGK